VHGDRDTGDVHQLKGTHADLEGVLGCLVDGGNIGDAVFKNTDSLAVKRDKEPIDGESGGVLGENSNLDIYSIFAEKTLKSMDSYAKEAGKRNKGFAFNVEEIPGENACPKMAMKDNFNFGTNLELLSNQMIPLYADVDLFTKLKVSSKLMNLVTGSSIFHFNVADELTPGANIELLRRLIEDYRIPHFALNKGFSTCANNHTTIGLTDICPECVLLLKLTLLES
jgi:anaerobic ribonucleoside-triphosphate reductase